MRLVLFEPDIPQNTGAILRLAACFGLGVDVVFPCGFIFDEPRRRRAGMDYLDHVDIARHVSFAAFEDWRRAAGRRLVLLTTQGATPYTDFAYQPDDILMVGRESAGAPADVHAAADARIVVPIRPELRSLNVAVAAAMVLGEALRQTAS